MSAPEFMIEKRPELGIRRSRKRERPPRQGEERGGRRGSPQALTGGASARRLLHDSAPGGEVCVRKIPPDRHRRVAPSSRSALSITNRLTFRVRRGIRLRGVGEFVA